MNESMEQLSKEQAIALHDSGTWKDWTHEEIAAFQLFQDKLAVPFGRFHEAVEKVLGRPVFTHEFADVESLRAEYRKERAPKTFAEILDMIPAEKRILIVAES